MKEAPDERYNRFEARLTELEKKFKFVNICRRCCAVFYKYPDTVTSCGGFVSYHFDKYSNEYCGKCLPLVLREEDLSEWARNNPDAAEECKKKHEKGSPEKEKK